MGKSPQSFGGRGTTINPGDFADNPHANEDHEVGFSEVGHDNADHATSYLDENGYRIFVNQTPDTPEEGDRVIDTSGSTVTEDVYDGASFVSVASSEAEYSDTDVEAFLSDPDNGLSSGVVLAQASEGDTAPGAGALAVDANNNLLVGK